MCVMSMAGPLLNQMKSTTVTVQFLYASYCFNDTNLAYSVRNQWTFNTNLKNNQTATKLLGLEVNLYKMLLKINLDERKILTGN